MDEYPFDFDFDLLQCKKKTFTSLFNLCRGSLQKKKKKIGEEGGMHIS